MVVMDSHDDQLRADFNEDVNTLAVQWASLGIDPDDFVKCSACGGYFEDAALDGDKVCSCEG